MISDRIREVRRKFKLTQSEFGDKLSVSRDVVKSYELGKVEPKDLFIKYLCTVFDVNEDWLRTGEGEMLYSSDPEAIADILFNLTLEENELMRQVTKDLQGLPESEVLLVHGIIKSILKKYDKKKTE